jgi:predicted small secreted protein
MKKRLVVLLILVFVTVTAGCAKWSRTGKGGQSVRGPFDQGETVYETL